MPSATAWARTSDPSWIWMRSASSGCKRSVTSVPMTASGSMPRSDRIAGLAYLIRRSAPITKVVSVECCTSDRNRSSLSRVAASASSLCSQAAPAIRITNASTNAPITQSASAAFVDRNDGIQSCPIATWPAAMPARLQIIVTRQVRDPSCARFSSATNVNAPVSTGPHPER